MVDRTAIGVTKHRLYEMHWAEHRTPYGIARELDVDADEVRETLDECGIPRRDDYDLGIDEDTAVTVTRQQYMAVDKRVLYELYWGEMLGAPSVGDRLGMTKAPVYEKLRKFGIPRRTGGPNNCEWFDTIASYKADSSEDYGDRETDIHNALAWLYDDCDGADPQRPYGPRRPWMTKKRYLYEQYWGKRKSPAEIAEENYVDRNVVLDHMREHGIPRIDAGSANKEWEKVPPKYRWPDIEGRGSETRPEEPSMQWRVES